MAVTASMVKELREMTGALLRRKQEELPLKDL